MTKRITNKALLRKVRRHTKLCAGCFGMWIYTPETYRIRLNRDELFRALEGPEDYGAFERWRGMTYHSKCVVRLKRLGQDVRGWTS